MEREKAKYLPGSAHEMRRLPTRSKLSGSRRKKSEKTCYMQLRRVSWRRACATDNSISTSKEPASLSSRLLWTSGALPHGVLARLHLRRVKLRLSGAPRNLAAVSWHGALSSRSAKPSDTCAIY